MSIKETVIMVNDVIETNTYAQSNKKLWICLSNSLDTQDRRLKSPPNQ